MNKALFLDRDGVINVDHGYVYQSKDIQFLPGIFDLCRHCHELGYLICVVTNQSGIARGYYSESDFLMLCEWMKLQFVKQGSVLNGIYYCPHHAELGLGEYHLDCNCRKPKPGMLLQAAEEFAVDMSNSIMIGDKLSDMMAADKAGITRRYLLNNQPGPAPASSSKFIQVASLFEIQQQITE